MATLAYASERRRKYGNESKSLLHDQSISMILPSMQPSVSWVVRCRSVTVRIGCRVLRKGVVLRVGAREHQFGKGFVPTSTEYLEDLRLVELICEHGRRKQSEYGVVVKLPTICGRLCSQLQLVVAEIAFQE